ncbi:MAG: NPCBM/NEW2 domain-containing protein, partial [Thermoguttaceae bacterium]|nr:NPCBM/NEW2 domain-containing protein [Thermoguttaceae bacterium]
MINRNCFLSVVLILAIAGVVRSQDSPCFEAVKTGVMNVKSPAQTVDVQLNQASDLSLVVTYGPDNYDYDQAAWCNPTLYDADGNAVDMTTLKPVSAQTGWGAMLINKDHAGRTVKICGKTFEKALYAHAPSILHYKLDGKYTRFTAEVGLVESAKNGTVTFEVYCHPVEYPSKAKYMKGMPGAPEPDPEPVPTADKAPFTFNAAAAQRLLDQGIEEIVFIRRVTLTSNHVYTDHVNSRWAPGGGLAILNLKTGKVRDVNPILAGGVINRFDVSFDAKKIVFDWKRSNQEGYRIYEINVDGTGLKQLTFPPEIEDALHQRFATSGYHRGTDDMQPCYLPDGGIAFITTRCLFSVLCDSGDNLTVSNLYRMNGDGSNMQPLTFSALSEQSPAVLPDGRILYHRWEYVDKAAGNVKALWAVNPDGTNSTEIYGNTITFPETMIYARPIPGTTKIVFLGASHCCPNNAMGTVIVIDVKDNVRSVDTMKYVTSDVAAFHHNGFHFKDDNGNWYRDSTGKPGRLFKDPYPINESLFLVSCKPKGLAWNDPTGYALSVLDGRGADELLLKDDS